MNYVLPLVGVRYVLPLVGVRVRSYVLPLVGVRSRIKWKEWVRKILKLCLLWWKSRHLRYLDIARR